MHKECRTQSEKIVTDVMHSLRTPLTAVKLYTEMLSDGGLGPLNEPQKDALKNIARSCKALQKQIDGLQKDLELILKRG